MSSSGRHWALFIDDMIHSIGRIRDICSRHTLESFSHDEDAIDLTTHHLEILGEASRHIPPVVIEKHPEIPWRVIQNTRNRIAHGYFSVNPATLWLTAQDDLPPLLRQLQALREEASES